jgi:putative glycosyltransferase (TIGR04372 family)
MLLINLTAVKNYIDSLPLNISARFIRPFVRFFKKTLTLCINFAYTPIAGVFWILKIKVPNFHISRLGHLVHDPSCFIKEHYLNSGRMPRAIMLAPRGASANRALARYWSKYFIVIENPIFAGLLQPLQVHSWTRFDASRYTGAMYCTADVFRISTEWGLRPPLLKLDRSDNERGAELLKKMGVPHGTWYVCVHVREAGYSPHDEYKHSFRNGSIADFEKAIAYIVSLGGFCIRMGDSTMRPAPKIPGLIDYALSPFRQDWMDLYLGATCKFFLGSNSGSHTLATVFGIPTAIVNWAPLTSIATGIKDLSIPMLYKQVHDGQILSFKHILQSPSAHFRETKEFEMAGIHLVHNTPEEILDLAVEQLQRVQGKFIVDAADELRQAQFMSMLKPGHYCFGTSSRIGNEFLKKYQHLLE